MHGEQTLPCKENDLRPTKDSRVLILGICGDIDICRGPCSELPEHVFKRDLTVISHRNSHDAMLPKPAPHWPKKMSTCQRNRLVMRMPPACNQTH